MPCVRGQAKDCMCACVLTFVTCWEVLRPVEQTTAVALHLFNFFLLFVNLFCRKPEIESLRFTCFLVDWFLTGGWLGQARLARTSGVADKFTTAKRKAGTLYRILRDTQLSFGCCVGLAQLKETPAHRTAASL